MFVFHRIDDVYAKRLDLMRILTLFERLDLPVILGVIPSRVTSEMASYLSVRSLFTVYQHGASHKNHSVDGRKDEFPVTRPDEETLRLIAEGRRRLEDDIGRVVSGYIPPWNTVSDGLLRALTTLNFTHLSAGRSTPAASQLQVLPVSVDTLASYAPPTAKAAAVTIADIERVLPRQKTVGVVYHIKDLPESGMAEIEAVMRWSQRHAPPPAKWRAFAGVP